MLELNNATVWLGVDGRCGFEALRQLLDILAQSVNVDSYEVVVF